MRIGSVQVLLKNILQTRSTKQYKNRKMIEKKSYFLKKLDCICFLDILCFNRTQLKVYSKKE